MGKPILSVVVPTKDRYKYLKHLIKLIQSYNSEDWEIVVQDNTDDNTEIVEFLNELNYSGCKYFHEKGQLPMTTNADKAILHSEGEYVCFLGDDDGICPNAIEYCKLMKEKGYEALRSNLPSYNWPDSEGKYDDHSGRVFVTKVTFDKKELDSINELRDVLNRGIIDRGNLPSVYHGIVARVALDKIYKKCNTFFPGQSPDISNGVATSLVVPAYLMVGDVVTISGASKFHGGKTKGMNKQYPGIKDVVWFRPEAEDNWDNKLPKIAVGSIIWAESCIETLRAMGREDIVDTIDYELIYKHFVTYYFPIREMVYHLSKTKCLPGYAYLLFLRRSIKAFERIVKSKLHLVSNKKVLRANDIQECVQVIVNR